MPLGLRIILVKAIYIIKLVLLALSKENKNNQITIFMISLGKDSLLIKVITILLWEMK